LSWQLVKNFLTLLLLFIKVQGRDRLYVKFVAEQLGLDGSYIPRTYIEQIQLEKLMNDVMVCTLHSKSFTLLLAILLSFAVVCDKMMFRHYQMI
jgi:hypothetical protein